jgi:amino acid adenylation domain-containing protein
LERQAEKIPYYIALIGAAEGVGGNMIQISYKEVNVRANGIARMLATHGAREETVVGIEAKRSVETVTGIFGILKAGAAYLPLDPELPPERIDYMLKDSRARILIKKSEIRNPKLETNPNNQKINVQNKNHFFGTALVLNYENLDFEFVSDFEFRASNLTPLNLAYLIYTSGSTGMPKGVMAEHRSVVNRLYWVQQQYRLGEQDVALQKTSFIFDVSVCELFRCIPGGGRVLLLPEGKEKEPGFMIETTARYRATTIDFTPPILDIFLDYIRGRGSAGKVASLRWVFVGVEIVGSELVRKFNEVLFASNATQLINAYGPTETTVDVTAFNCSLEEFQAVVPIGKPMGNTRVYILDKYGNAQPIGVVGELYIGGDSVTRGYLNNPQLTAEKFIKNRFYRTYSAYIFYKTGDLGRRLPDGNIEFTGRIDRQVKIRGMRIELGEIEDRLLQYKKVKEAVVLAKKDSRGAGYLCAYIVPAPGDKTQLPASELKEYLSGFLPDYMTPSRFVLLEDIPLTPTGKIDRHALPEPPSLESAEKGVFDPVTSEEKILLEVWAEVLGIQRPGPRDHFFELGGDSIKAIQLAARLHTRGFALKLADIFLNPRIRELSAHIHRANEVPRDNARNGKEPELPHDHTYYDQDLNSEELDAIKRKIESIDWRGEFS